MKFKLHIATPDGVLVKEPVRLTCPDDAKLFITHGEWGMHDIFTGETEIVETYDPVRDHSEIDHAKIDQLTSEGYIVVYRGYYHVKMERFGKSREFYGEVVNLDGDTVTIDNIFTPRKIKKSVPKLNTVTARHVTIMSESGNTILEGYEVKEDE